MVPSRRRTAQASLALLLLALPGCATAARARAAQDASSAIPGERTPTAAELGLPTKGRVALGVLVRTALRIHPSVVAARRASEAAFARVRAAEGARLPQVSVGAAAAFRDASQNGTNPVEHRFQSLGFDVSWVLFDFGELAAFARQAGQQWMAAQQDVRTAEVDAAFAVRTAYFELDKNIQLLGVARATVAQFEARLAQVTELEHVGKRIRVKGLPFKIHGLLDRKGTNTFGQDQYDASSCPGPPPRRRCRARRSTRSTRSWWRRGRSRTSARSRTRCGRRSAPRTAGAARAPAPSPTISRSATCRVLKPAPRRGPFSEPGGRAVPNLRVRVPPR